MAWHRPTLALSQEVHFEPEGRWRHTRPGGATPRGVQNRRDFGFWLRIDLSSPDHSKMYLSRTLPYAWRTKRPLDVVQWLQVIAQQTQVAAEQTASHPASHRCAQCKRWHNLSSAKCFRSCVHAFSAALHARKMLGQIPVVLKLQRSTIYGSAQQLPQILHAFMVALNE